MKNLQGRMKRIQEKVPIFLKTSEGRHIALCLKKAVEETHA